MNPSTLLRFSILSFACVSIPLAHAEKTELSKLRLLWFDECGRCHGDDGKAATVLGKKLHIRDYSSKKQQAEFTDAQALETIVNGKMRGDKKVMPGFAEQLSEEQSKELVGYLRSLAKD